MCELYLRAIIKKLKRRGEKKKREPKALTDPTTCREPRFDPWPGN